MQTKKREKKNKKIRSIRPFKLIRRPHLGRFESGSFNLKRHTNGQFFFILDLDFISYLENAALRKNKFGQVCAQEDYPLGNAVRIRRLAPPGPDSRPWRRRVLRRRHCSLCGLPMKDLERERER